MTELETKLSHAVWCYRNSVWTTVQKGVGFAIHQSNNRMWLAGYSEESVAQRQEIYHDEAPYITVGRDPCNGSMFNIPASNDFIVAVVLKHYPKLLL